MPNETVLITGASSGIGQDLARLFAADGSRLVLVARRREALQSLADELRGKHNIETIVESLDLADPAAPQQLFDRLNGQGIDIDVVANNAGFGALGNVADLPIDRQLGMIQVNVMALAALTRLFLPGMLGRRRGGILNVGSTAGFQPGPHMAIYYATKAFVLSFTEAVAEEVAGSGVKVSCLCPGPTKTGFGAESGMDATPVFRVGTMRSPDVARIGYRGFRAGKVIVIPGFTNRLAVFWDRLLPRAVIRKIVKRLNSPGGKL